MDGTSADALLARLRDGEVLWLLHVNADPDCVGAAYALREAFGGVVGAPDGLSRAGGRLAEHLGLAVDLWPHPENFRVVVAVDTSSRSQLGRLGPRVAAPLLVDHHRYGDLQAFAPALAWDPSRSSCCEVVLELLDRAGKPPAQKAALALLAGLVSDTARFRHADARSFEAAARLLPRAGLPMERVLALLEGEGEDDAQSDLSLRRATLLAASRAEVETVGGFLVATSEVGSFDAAAATALVRAGADLAIVACERSDQVRMSLRASHRLQARGLHLGEVANGAAREVGWSGGGHEGAAGLTGKADLARARDAVKRLARRTMEAP